MAPKKRASNKPSKKGPSISDCPKCQFIHPTNSTCISASSPAAKQTHVKVEVEDKETRKALQTGCDIDFDKSQTL